MALCVRAPPHSGGRPRVYVVFAACQLVSAPHVTLVSTPERGMCCEMTSPGDIFYTERIHLVFLSRQPTLYHVWEKIVRYMNFLWRDLQELPSWEWESETGGAPCFEGPVNVQFRRGDGSRAPGNGGGIGPL